MTPRDWRAALGARIEERRGRESIRSAARRGGVDEAVWRQVERGFRTIAGAKIPANPRDDNLEAIVLAVGIDPEEAFAAVGRDYEPSRRPRPDTDRLSAVEADLAEIREQVEEVARRLDQGGGPA